MSMEDECLKVQGFESPLITFVSVCLLAAFPTMFDCFFPFDIVPRPLPTSSLYVLNSSSCLQWEHTQFFMIMNALSNVSQF